MPLQAVYKTESEIPEGAVPFFKEQADGTFKLDLDGELKTQADIDRVKASLDKQRDINEDLTRKLSKVPDDFDADTWDKVKDIDPDNLPKGDIDEDTEKEIQKRVASQVREKEQEIKNDLEGKYNSRIEEVNKKEKAILETHKENWVKQHLQEKYGFSDPKRLRWMMLDIEAGQHPELKRKIDSIKVEDDNGRPKIVGGDLKDEQGALEVLENISESEVSRDYKPASNNSGGGAPTNNGDGGSIKDNPYKEESMNFTKQAKIEKENPEKARKMAKEAGLPENEIAKIGKQPR